MNYKSEILQLYSANVAVWIAASFPSVALVSVTVANVTLANDDDKSWKADKTAAT